MGKKGGKTRITAGGNHLLVLLIIISLLLSPATLAEPPSLTFTEPGEQTTLSGGWGKFVPLDSGLIQQKHDLSAGLGLSAFSLIPSVSAQSTVCCKTENYWCQDVPLSACCPGGCGPGQSESLPCHQTDCSLVYGCCIADCGSGADAFKTLGECGFPGDSSMFAPGEFCESLPECTEGVCKDESTSPASCRIDVGKNCHGVYESFYPGETDMVAICMDGPPLVGAISGTVTDMTGNPVSAATVTIYSDPTKTAITDSSGGFAITNIRIGTYRVVVTKSPHTPVENSSVQVESNQNTPVYFVMDTGTTQLTGDISGTVWDEYPGRPLALSYVVWSEHGQSRGSYTDSQGNYIITGIPAGTRSVTASKTGYIQASTSGTVSAGTSTPGFDITLARQPTSAACGNGIIDTEQGESCDIGLPGQPAVDSDCPGYCRQDCTCPTSCSAIEGFDNTHECDYDFQCPGSEVTFNSLINPLRTTPPFDDNPGDLIFGIPSGGQRKICCSEPCIAIPECVRDARIFETYAALDNQEICRCGQHYFETRGNNYFCCETPAGGTEFSQFTCENLVPVSGYVTDSQTGAGIPFATVLIYYGVVVKDEITTNDQGYYTYPLSIGKTYSFVVSAENYSESITDYTVPVSAPYTHDIQLVGYDPCVVGGPGTTLALTASIAQMGLPHVYLDWTLECGHTVSNYQIWKTSSGIEELVTTVSGTTTSFVDTGTEMDMIITYRVVAVFDSTSNPEATDTIYTGDPLCEGKTSMNHEFCTDPSFSTEDALTYRMACDMNNMPHLTRGSGRFDDYQGNCTRFGIGQTGEAAFCRYISSTTTECFIPDDCELTGLGNPVDVIGENVFGLYYSWNYGLSSSGFTLFTCTEKREVGGTLETRYCYLDYSDTTVDSCNSCSWYGSCFDYQSASACLADTCGYGAKLNTQCAYYHSSEYFSELGKGVCYPVGYEGTDYCESMCGDNTFGFFRNRGCTQDLCSTLGRCFSMPSESSGGSTCRSCSNPTCEAYGTNMEACIGPSAQPFEVQGTCDSSTEFTYSTDSCGIGTCAFVDGRCIKDADGNNADDCADSTSSDACNSDNMPPRTAITSIPPYINVAGGNVTFKISDPPFDTEEKTLYWCIDEAECCPDQTARSTDEISLHFSGETHPDIESMMNIFFFSKDSHNNIENLRNISIFFDTLPPSFGEPVFDIRNRTSIDERSIVWVTLEIIENRNYTSCEFDVIGGVPEISLTDRGPPYLTTDNLIITSRFENRQASGGAPGLPDGSYTFTATCTDKAGNTASRSWPFSINRVNRILSVWPNQTVSASQLRFAINASDNYAYCEAVHGDRRIRMNPDVYNPANGPYLFISTLASGFSDGDYNIPIHCYESEGTEPAVSANALFTVDQTAPTTVWKVYNGYGGYEDFFQGRTYGPSTFRAFCIDPDIDFQGRNVEFPWQGEFGCDPTNSTYTCMTDLPCSTLDCRAGPFTNTYEYAFTQSGRYCMCSYSTDRGLNAETVSCIDVRINADNPLLRIDSPYNRFSTMLSYAQVDFSWDFAGGQSDVYLTWRSGDMVDYQTVHTRVSGESGSDFLTIPELYPGLNYIELALYDESYTGGTHGVARHTIEIFYDLIGPNLTNAQVINSKNERIDHDSGTAHVSGFGETLTFRIIANDYLYTDPLNQRTDDIHQVTVLITQPEPYASRGPFVMHNTGGPDFEYVFDPLEEGYLFSGTHTVTYTASDTAYSPGGEHNENSYSQTFTVNETIVFNSAIYEVSEESWKRIDLSSFAEFGSTIALNATVSNPYYIIDMDVRITCIDYCISPFTQDYRMERTNDTDPNFHQLITPPLSSSGGSYMGPGYYRAMFILTTIDGRHQTFNNTFSILDTMKPNFTITIETPHTNPDGLPVITNSKTDSLLYYDVIVSASEPVNITTLAFTVRGATTRTFSLDTFMEPIFTTDWNYRIAIPFDDPFFMRLHGNNSAFVIEAADLSGNTADSSDILSGRYFEIDTFGGYAPILNPALLNMSIQTITALSLNGTTNPAEEGVTLEISVNDQITTTLSGADGGFSAQRQLTATGGNRLTITPIDYLDNVGDSLERIIIYDNTPPQLISTRPLDGEIVPSVNSVNATFFDPESAVVPSSLSMTINGNPVTVSTQIYETYYTSMAYRSTLATGEYTVTVTATNHAGLTTTETFSFSIDPTVPLTPVFNITDGIWYDDPINKWYIDSDDGFDFEVTFTPESDTFRITSATLVEDPSVPITCTGSGSSFDCTAEGPIEEGTYTLRVEAERELVPGTFGNPGVYETQIEIDTTDPEIEFDNIVVYTNDGQATIEGTYSGLDPDDQITITGPISSSDVDMDPVLHEFTADIILDTSEPGNYTVYVTATDKAGNTHTVPVTVVYDLTGTPPRITNVLASSSDYNILQINSTYYLTNAGTVQWAITIEGTSEPGRLEVWKSHETSSGRSAEIRESMTEIDETGTFRVNLTLGQANGENYIRLVSVDLAGNSAELRLTILSDTTGADIHEIRLEQLDTAIAQIGSTRPQLGVSSAILEDCNRNYVIGTYAWDSCQINNALAGDDASCVKIQNSYLKMSCCSYTGTCDSFTVSQATLGCSSTCIPAGSVRCNPSFNAYDRCEDREGNGCNEWVLRGYCAPGHCVEGQCIMPD